MNAGRIMCQMNGGAFVKARPVAGDDADFRASGLWLDEQV
jgi:hypothetical protein